MALIKEYLSAAWVVGIMILGLLLKDITETKSVGPSESIPDFTASLA
jgi:hypothetical protein